MALAVGKRPDRSQSPLQSGERWESEGRTSLLISTGALFIPSVQAHSGGVASARGALGWLLPSLPASLRGQKLFGYTCSDMSVDTLLCAFPGRRLPPVAWRSYKQWWKWEVGLVAGEGTLEMQVG